MKTLQSFRDCVIGKIYHTEYTYTQIDKPDKKSYEFICVKQAVQGIRGKDLKDQNSDVMPWGRPHDNACVSEFIMFEITKEERPEYFV